MVGGRDLHESHSPAMASKQLLSIGETEFLADPGSLMRQLLCYGHMSAIWLQLLGTEEHWLPTAPRLKAIPFWACFLLDEDHPERCSKHKTPSNRYHRNKCLKDHLVLELTLIDSEKGNCTIQGWIWTRNKIFLHVYFKMHILERTE